MLHAVVTSDWHLEAMEKHFSNSVDIQLQDVDKIYRYAVEQGIPNVLILGDISDTAKMSDDTKRKLLQFFLRYDGIINTYYVGGNHDWADHTTTSMDLIATLCEWNFLKTFKMYLRPEQIEIDGVVVNMLPYPATESIKSKRPCLNLCHTETIGAIGDNGRPLKTSHDLVVHERDVTISGHIHLYQWLRDKKFLYCGSPYQKTFGESLPKGYCEIRVKEVGKKLDFKHRFLEAKPSFILQTMLIKDQSDFTKLETNPNIRYRLYIEDGVIVPADLRVRIPNIAQVLGASKTQTLVLEQKSVVITNPKSGLKDLLVSEGATKRQLNMCKKFVENALHEIGFATA